MSGRETYKYSPFILAHANASCFKHAPGTSITICVQSSVSLNEISNDLTESSYMFLI